MSTKPVTSPRGNDAILHYREDTTDLATIGSTWSIWGPGDDEYGLAGLHLTGTAIDVGAHIGSVALALLADNPELRVIAVEPLAENVAVMRLSADENGWSDRLTIIEGGIAKGKTTRIAWDFAGDEDMRKHRYIGGLGSGTKTEHQTARVAGIRLGELIEDDCPFLKIDCEGCEWVALADPRIGYVKRIVGEYHHRGSDGLHRLLDATHDVTIQSEGDTGLFTAVRRA